ncbi:hypothetical protein [Mycolicibacterium gilvum]|uniref:Secreted protein n=1 Tax=Mycolicibacterium gilvum TaxID=1804 RepID=A0A378SEJ7_9MYCO|nr:hypothetical protein [Mycolicibacterium gilvum]MCV7055197.1 hypothetical protein [Mycolicibacterium gilvum]STZ41153.1 Uncharacterised protein [Mycolicibacterium gilvum]
MNRSLFVAGVGSAAAALALGLSGVASAEPEDPAPVVDGTAAEAPSAADEVAALRAEGKSVQVIGNDNGMLANCDVVNTTEGGEANTVVMEVDCGLNYP